MIKYILILLTATLLMNCKSNDYLTPYEYEGAVLSFGNGGGFSGRVLEYTLMDNGQLFKDTNKEGNVLVLNKVDKRQAKQIFNNYTTLGLDKLTINDPGNMYYFITKKVGDQTQKIKWGGPNEPAPEVLKVFFKTLMQTTRDQSSSSIKQPDPVK